MRLGLIFGWLQTASKTESTMAIGFRPLVPQEVDYSLFSPDSS